MLGAISGDSMSLLSISERPVCARILKLLGNMAGLLLPATFQSRLTTNLLTTNLCTNLDHKSLV